MTKNKDEKINFDPKSLKDVQFAKFFKTESKKLFTDYMFVDGKQYILVKTWQKIFYEYPSLENLPTQGIQSLESNKYQLSKFGSLVPGAHGIKRYDSDDEQESQNFFIKTLQIFDKENKALGEPILVEQVYGNFDQYRIYDISTLHFEDKLYYFKRIHIDESNIEGDGQVDQDATNNKKIWNNLLHFQKAKDKQDKHQVRHQQIQHANYKRRHSAKAPEFNKRYDIGCFDRAIKKNTHRTHLQLYSYDLRNGQENKIDWVKIEELPIEALD